MEWVRGEKIGHGSFGSVHLAIPRNQNLPLMAVKSCAASNSGLLRHEKNALGFLGADCSQITRCLGDSSSLENGESFYNVLMEYAVGGNLADRVRNCSGGLPEFEIRRHTRSVLIALSHIHRKGFVHCDVKLQNILLFLTQEEGEIRDDAKIADFGLCRRKGESRGTEIRGTPLYMSPESVNSGEYEAPADVWALGCAVAEMVTGNPAWRCEPGCDVTRLLFRIGAGEELPEVPGALSEEGKEFLGKCFIKDPKERWTAEMLLNHPFLVNEGKSENNNSGMTSTVPLEVVKEEPSTSPRGPFDFVEFDSKDYSFCSSIPVDFDFDFDSECGSSNSLFDSSSAAKRIELVASGEMPDWSISEGWISVRGS